MELIYTSNVDDLFEIIEYLGGVSLPIVPASKKLFDKIINTHDNWIRCYRDYVRCIIDYLQMKIKHDVAGRNYREISGRYPRDQDHCDKLYEYQRAVKTQEILADSYIVSFYELTDCLDAGIEDQLE